MKIKVDDSQEFEFGAIKKVYSKNGVMHIDLFGPDVPKLNGCKVQEKFCNGCPYYKGASLIKNVWRPDCSAEKSIRYLKGLQCEQDRNNKT